MIKEKTDDEIVKIMDDLEATPKHWTRERKIATYHYLMAQTLGNLANMGNTRYKQRRPYPRKGPTPPRS